MISLSRTSCIHHHYQLLFLLPILRLLHQLLLQTNDRSESTFASYVDVTSPDWILWTPTHSIIVQKIDHDLWTQAIKNKVIQSLIQLRNSYSWRKCLLICSVGEEDIGDGNEKGLKMNPPNLQTDSSFHSSLRSRREFDRMVEEYV